MVRFALFSLLALSALAQDEAGLRRAFEGRMVRVKIDMPGTHEGVDIHWGKEQPLDVKSYAQRLKNNPVAVARGDSILVTIVRVKSKNIEFQLGGGGYGTFGDDSGTVPVPSVSKTSRQKQLEDDAKKESDPKRRDSLNREISRLEDDRRREESRARARADELRAQKRFEVDEKRRRGGSRFNVWFPDKYLTGNTPMPEELERILSEWVEFQPAQLPPAPPAR